MRAYGFVTRFLRDISPRRPLLTSPSFCRCVVTEIASSKRRAWWPVTCFARSRGDPSRVAPRSPGRPLAARASRTIPTACTSSTGSPRRPEPFSRCTSWTTSVTFVDVAGSEDDEVHMEEPADHVDRGGHEAQGSVQEERGHLRQGWAAYAFSPSRPPPSRPY